MWPPAWALPQRSLMFLRAAYTLCACCSLCLKQSSPRYPHRFYPFLQAFAQMLPLSSPCPCECRDFPFPTWPLPRGLSLFRPLTDPLWTLLSPVFLLSEAHNPPSPYPQASQVGFYFYHFSSSILHLVMCYLRSVVPLAPRSFLIYKVTHVPYLSSS